MRKRDGLGEYKGQKVITSTGHSAGEQSQVPLKKIRMLTGIKAGKAGEGGRSAPRERRRPGNSQSATDPGTARIRLDGWGSARGSEKKGGAAQQQLSLSKNKRTPRMQHAPQAARPDRNRGSLSAMESDPIYLLRNS